MTNEVIRFFEKADEVWIPKAAVEETIREYGFKGKVVVVENGNDLQGWIQLKNSSMNRVIF